MKNLAGKEGEVVVTNLTVDVEEIKIRLEECLLKFSSETSVFLSPN